MNPALAISSESLLYSLLFLVEVSNFSWNSSDAQITTKHLVSSADHWTFFFSIVVFSAFFPSPSCFPCSTHPLMMSQFPRKSQLFLGSAENQLFGFRTNYFFSLNAPAGSKEPCQCETPICHTVCLHALKTPWVCLWCFTNVFVMKSSCCDSRLWINPWLFVFAGRGRASQWRHQVDHQAQSDVRCQDHLCEGSGAQRGGSLHRWLHLYSGAGETLQSAKHQNGWTDKTVNMLLISYIGMIFFHFLYHDVNFIFSFNATWCTNTKHHRNISSPSLTVLRSYIDYFVPCLFAFSTFFWLDWKSLFVCSDLSCKVKY